MKKIPTILMASLLASLFFVAEVMTPNASAVKGDNAEEHVVIAKTEFSPHQALNRKIDIVVRYTFTWVNDPQLKAPSKTVLSLNRPMSNIVNTTSAKSSINYLRPFTDVDFLSVGNYVFKLKTEIISQSMDGIAMPWADGTQFIAEAKEHEVIVAVRSADPQQPGQNLTLQVITKEEILLPVHLNQAENASVLVTHHTKGLMGEKDKLFDYEINIAGLPDAVVHIYSEGKTSYLVSNQPLCEKIQKKEPPNIQVDCIKTIVSLKDGESIEISSGLAPGDSISISQVGDHSSYVTSVNDQTGVTSKQIKILPTNNPLAASNHALSFESRREGSPATGIVLKAAPFIGIAGMGGIGAFVVYEARKRR